MSQEYKPIQCECGNTAFERHTEAVGEGSVKINVACLNCGGRCSLEILFTSLDQSLEGQMLQVIDDIIDEGFREFERKES